MWINVSKIISTGKPRGHLQVSPDLIPTSQWGRIKQNMAKKELQKMPKKRVGRISLGTTGVSEKSYWRDGTDATDESLQKLAEDLKPQIQEALWTRAD